MGTPKRLTLDERRARYREWVTARLADHAAVTPTSSEKTSGALTTVALKTPVERPGYGSAHLTPMPDKIRDRAGGTGHLLAWAKHYAGNYPAVKFVREVFEGPIPPSAKPPEDYRKGALYEGSLDYWGVLAFATEWDRMGPSTPSEFVDALSCEVSGSARGAAVESVLRSIGHSNMSYISDIDDADDDYSQWRYGSRKER